MHRPRPSLLLVLCALGSASFLPLPADAGAPSSPRTPRQMVAQYFADLNAHRFHAAWRLEAPCGVSFSVSNGPGVPVGTAGYPGRGTWSAPKGKYAQHPILASASVTRIDRLHIPVLTRNHILAFGVKDWFRFDYSAAASNVTFNYKHNSGFHMIKIGMWK